MPTVKVTFLAQTVVSFQTYQSFSFTAAVPRPKYWPPAFKPTKGTKAPPITPPAKNAVPLQKGKKLHLRPPVEVAPPQKGVKEHGSLVVPPVVAPELPSKPTTRRAQMALPCKPEEKSHLVIPPVDPPGLPAKPTTHRAQRALPSKPKEESNLIVPPVVPQRRKNSSTPDSAGKVLLSFLSNKVTLCL